MSGLLLVTQRMWLTHRSCNSYRYCMEVNEPNGNKRGKLTEQWVGRGGAHKVFLKLIFLGQRIHCLLNHQIIKFKLFLNNGFTRVHGDQSQLINQTINKKTAIIDLINKRNKSFSLFCASLLLYLFILFFSHCSRSIIACITSCSQVSR